MSTSPTPPVAGSAESEPAVIDAAAVEAASALFVSKDAVTKTIRNMAQSACRAGAVAELLLLANELDRGFWGVAEYGTPDPYGDIADGLRERARKLGGA